MLAVRCSDVKNRIREKIARCNAKASCVRDRPMAFTSLGRLASVVVSGLSGNRLMCVVVSSKYGGKTSFVQKRL